MLISKVSPVFLVEIRFILVGLQSVIQLFISLKREDVCVCYALFVLVQLLGLHTSWSLFTAL